MGWGTGTVLLEDYTGAPGRVTVGVNGDINTVEEVADFLKDHSDAKVVSYSFSQSKVYSGDDTDEGKYDRVSQKLRFNYSDSEEENPRKRQISFTIPAPRDEDVNDDQEADSDVAEDVKDLLESVRGGELEYKGGYLTSKKPRQVAKKLTGV